MAAGFARPLRIAHVTTVDESLRYLLLAQLRFLRNAGHEVIGISAPGPYVAELVAHGIPHLAVPLTRRLTPLADLQALWRLWRIFRQHRFDVVHTHTPKPGVLGQLAARLAGVPIVVNTVHGFYFHEGTRALPRAVMIALERLAARCSSRILSQSAEDVRTAIAEGIARRGEIVHLGNGIDVAQFDAGRFSTAERLTLRSRYRLAPDDLVVGFVGRLVREKGILDLLDAVARLAPLHPGLRLLAVGRTDTHKHDAVDTDAAAAAGVAERCRFVGQQAEMPPVYAIMDIFCLPSYREGMPRAPMEASAMSLPCVATDVRGCREVVFPGVNGLLVPPRRPDQLAKALAKLIEDENLRCTLGQGGRACAEERFDQRRVFRLVLETYADLATDLGGRGSRDPLSRGNAS